MNDQYDLYAHCTAQHKHIFNQYYIFMHNEKVHIQQFQDLQLGKMVVCLIIKLEFYFATII